ncbi:carboxypeptidase regulatory-like domain-containing protein [Acidicapsa dinghuensis]|uniref:Carboxypeptidase regulatory-like domain-containing protein n=1 Tax=Acidicapsa dinghuensis TaxID=2218256 RepID=A0ABW1EH76_9BACT|nr:carboxypeptidase regulatory-like domain-containing protein [Acidicapsa dinghuensis]
MQLSKQYESAQQNFLRSFCIRLSAHMTFIFPWALRATAAAALVSAVSACAQTGQGAIGGSVRDNSGSVISGAEVEVLSGATGVKQTTTTNQNGLFQIQSLNPGLYTVIVQKDGFERATAESVNVSGVGTTPIDITLTIGAVSHTVTVNADADLLTKTESNVTTTVDHAIVENLPYPERSSLEASLLVPGVVGDPLQPGGISTENPNAYTSYVTPGAGIVVGGAPPGTSSIVVDGSDVTQPSLARTGVNLSGHEVQETTVIVTGLSAKYGRTGGGVIVQSSAAGTNQYHGAITYSHTDPYFNAFPDGNTAPSALHENYYGFYAGGPVWVPKIYPHKDRTFFFVGVEPARLQNAFGFRGIFPTPDELAGHLQNSLTLLNQSILKSSGYAAALAAPRIGSINYQSTINANGFPDGPYDTSQIRAIANNDVSAQLAQNPFAQFVLSQFPTPNNPGPYIKFDNPQATPQNDGTNATYQRGVLNTDNRYSIRIDQHFNNNDRLFARYTVIPVSAARFFAVDQSNPLTIVPTDSASTHDIALGYTHTFSSSIVNSFHYSFMRVNQQRLAPPSTRNKDYAAAYGLTPASFGYGFPSLGNLNANGVSYTMQMGLSTAAIQVDQNFIAGDDLTWTHGNHLFQFGGEVRWMQSNQYDLGGATGGRYSFSAGQTNNGSTGGAPLATFILGTISSFSNTPVEIPGYYRWRYYAGYFQDDWRILSNLTINAGLRYELETPRMEKFNNQAYVGLNIPGNLNGLATTAAFCFSGACGNPKTLWPINYMGFEPRIGVAYSPTLKTSVRAAYTLQRLPLTGYENIPDPDFNVASQAVGNQSGGVTANSTVNYITNPVGPLTSAYTALNGNRGPILYSNGLAPVFVEHSSKVPYTQSWNLTLQYQPATRTILQASYNGAKGTHLVGPFGGAGTAIALNVPDLSTIVNAIQTHQNLGRNFPNPWGITQNGSLVSETGLQALNPYQNFFNQSLNYMYPRGGTMEYNGMYLSVNQRFGAGLSLLANYTWSKTLDNIPDTNTGANGGGFGYVVPQNPLNPYAEWSVASFDQASRLKAGYTYDLPIGTGHLLSLHNRVLDNLIGNISTAGIATYADGLPNAITLGTVGYFVSVTPSGVNGCITSGSNQFCTANALPAGYTLRPNIVPGVPLINKNWKKNALNSNFTPYLNTAAFSVPGSLSNPQLGNAPRLLANARSPREALFDMHFTKGFKFGERYDLKINSTFINVFNHPVYYGVNHSLLSSNTVSNVTGTVKPVTTASFGEFNQSQTAGMSRVIQVGGEFTF